MQTWKTRSKQMVLDHGRFLKVEMHAVELPDGTVIEDWPWVITPDFINVVAVTADNRFLLFKQTKYAVDGITLAPVGGYIEQNEDPLLAAKRELLEETGYEAPKWTALGNYAIDGNRGAGTGYLFLAEGAVKSSNMAESDDLEEQEILLLSRDEVEAALNRGDFKVMPWATNMALALLRLGV